MAIVSASRVCNSILAPSIPSSSSPAGASEHTGLGGEAFLEAPMPQLPRSFPAATALAVALAAVAHAGLAAPQYLLQPAGEELERRHPMHPGVGAVAAVRDQLHPGALRVV